LVAFFIELILPLHQLCATLYKNALVSPL